MRPASSLWIAIVVLVAASLGPAEAVVSAKGPPAITLIFTKDSEVLAEAPGVLEPCFAAPIDVRNLAPSPCRAPGKLPSPSPSGRPPGSPTPQANDKKVHSSGPDILLLVLLTTGASGGAAVIGLIGYVIRRRVGFSPHSPPPRDGDGGPQYH